MKGPYRVPYCALHYAIAFIITLFRRKIRQSLDFVETLRQRIQIGQPVFHVITPRDVFDTWTDTKNRIVSRNLVIEMKKFTRRKENMRREIEKRWEKLDSRTNFHLLAVSYFKKITVDRWKTFGSDTNDAITGAAVNFDWFGSAPKMMATRIGV